MDYTIYNILKAAYIYIYRPKSLSQKPPKKDAFLTYLASLKNIINTAWNTAVSSNVDIQKSNILCALSLLMKESTTISPSGGNNATLRAQVNASKKQWLAETVVQIIKGGLAESHLAPNLNSSSSGGLKEVSRSGLPLCHVALISNPDAKDGKGNFFIEDGMVRSRIEEYLDEWVEPEPNENVSSTSKPIPIPTKGRASLASSSAAASSSRQVISPHLSTTFPKVNSTLLAAATHSPSYIRPPYFSETTAAVSAASSAAPVAASHPELIPAQFTTRDEYVVYAAKILSMLLLKSCEEFYLGFCRPRSIVGILPRMLGWCGTESARATFIKTILRNVYTVCYTTLRDAASAETGTTSRQVPAIITYTRICKYIKNIIHPCMLNLIGRLMYAYKAKSKTADKCVEEIVSMIMGAPPTALSLDNFDIGGTYTGEHSEHELECIYGRLPSAALDTVISRLPASGSKNQYTAQEVKTYITSGYYTYLIGRISREDRLSHADELLSDIYRLLIDDPTYTRLFATIGGAKYKKRRTIKKRRTFRKRRTIRRHK